MAIHSTDTPVAPRPLFYGSIMPVRPQRISSWLFAAVTAACVIASMPFAAGGADDEGSAIYGVKIPPGYRGWEVVSVAHEAGNLNDIRAILGNPCNDEGFS